MPGGAFTHWKTPPFHGAHPEESVPYEFRGADELICDFFAAVERACETEGVPFEFDAEEVELEELEEYDDDPQVAE